MFYHLQVQSTSLLLFLNNLQHNKDYHHFLKYYSRPNARQPSLSPPTNPLSPTSHVITTQICASKSSNSVLSRYTAWISSIIAASLLQSLPTVYGKGGAVIGGSAGGGQGKLDIRFLINDFVVDNKLLKIST